MTGKLRIDLQILLPQVPDESDACVRRLIHDLESRDGIVQVHLRPGSDGTPTQLCVHHDPDVVPLARIDAHLLNREGVALGTVRELLATGPQTVLVLAYEQDGKAQERMIPFVSAFVDAVDLPGKRITVDWQPDY